MIIRTLLKPPDFVLNSIEKQSNGIGYQCAMLSNELNNKRQSQSTVKTSQNYTLVQETNEYKQQSSLFQMYNNQKSRIESELPPLNSHQKKIKVLITNKICNPSVCLDQSVFEQLRSCGKNPDEKIYEVSDPTTLNNLHMQLRQHNSYSIVVCIKISK